MIDPDAFAALICDWCLEVAPGQQVLINASVLAQAPAVALHRALLERGAWPLVRLSPPELRGDLLRYASASSSTASLSSSCWRLARRTRA